MSDKAPLEGSSVCLLFFWATKEERKTMGWWDGILLRIWRWPHFIVSVREESTLELSSWSFPLYHNALCIIYVYTINIYMYVYYIHTYILFNRPCRHSLPAVYGGMMSLHCMPICRQSSRIFWHRSI
jgi:uncharacterized protein with PQ loop repeat